MFLINYILDLNINFNYMFNIILKDFKSYLLT